MASHEGGCLCGAVRYRLEADDYDTNYCHCRSCRVATGGPVAAFVDLQPGQFSWTKGEPAFFASSPGVRRGFCRTCGTAMTYESDTQEGEVHVLTPTLYHPDAFPPSNVFHEDERIPWLHLAMTGATS